MSDELLIKCGSPTLAGLKTGNMFSYPYVSREEVKSDLRRLNKILVPKGLRVLPLRYSDKTVADQQAPQRQGFSPRGGALP